MEEKGRILGERDVDMRRTRPVVGKEDIEKEDIEKEDNRESKKVVGKL